MGRPSLTALSKVVSHALRHETGRYGLELDSNGWVRIDDLLAALVNTDEKWGGLGAEDLGAMIDASDKKRHEIANGLIRARYGHSTAARIDRTEAVPPAILFHGTPPRNVERILRDGLRPMQRQYVHLSLDTETASQVAKRRCDVPAIFQVAAARASEDGVRFYIGNDQIWLSDPIGPNYLTLLK